MRWLLLLVIACAPSGCDIVFHIDPIGEGSDQTIDAIGPKADGIEPVCSLVGQYGPGGLGLLSYCVRSDSLQTMMLGGGFDTTANAKCDYVVAGTGSGAPTVCVVSAHVIDVTSVLAVTGDKPLVLAALGTINIAAEIDLTGGGGASAAACKLEGEGGAGGMATAGGGGGGGGGGWQTHGGAGGNGSGINQGHMGITSGLPREIRGGCPGGTGGQGGQGGPGKGANGGGAIYIAARDVVHVTAMGAINASGLGGRGGALPNGGGGGGGSGGMIAFDSPLITFDFLDAPGAKIFANGGGGGAGGNAVAGTSSSNPATGGIGGSPTGGDGSLAQGVGADGGTSSGSGGGGGGGGQGYIVVYTTGVIELSPTHVSPAMVAGI
jgi:hypothetical protein